MDIIIWVVIAIIGAAIGFAVSKFLDKSKAEQANRDAKNIVNEAKSAAKTIKREAEIEAKDNELKLRQQIQNEKNEKLKDVREAENRINKREDALNSRDNSLNSREKALDGRESQLATVQNKLDEREKALSVSEEKVSERLQKVAGMSAEEAKAELLDTLKGEVSHDAAAIIRDAEARTKADADKNARSILGLAIQRIAADFTAETTVKPVHIPSDDIKGRIIGREGRNIRSFEQVTGTTLIIDDTPECITISCGDHVRREIARIALEKLVADGRIHPARIEEMYNKAKKQVNKQIQEAGEQASFDSGAHDLHPELVTALGRLRFRTSYGQNVLNHSLEVAYLSGIMASELGLDETDARRAGLLHDLGKSVDHEIQGSHAVIGADMARRFGEAPEIVHAIEAHHNDVEPNSVLDVLVQAADAVSAARPGARKETLDAYIKRLEKLEGIANSYEGVNRTYAIQAGREVRVMVEPSIVDEDRITVLAHDISKRIENELQYPGQVKVVVIRESRAVDIAK